MNHACMHLQSNVFFRIWTFEILSLEDNVMKWDAEKQQIEVGAFFKQFLPAEGKAVRESMSELINSSVFSYLVVTQVWWHHNIRVK